MSVTADGTGAGVGFATRCNALLGVVHSAYEVAGGVGLPAQDIVGLPAALALHAAVIVPTLRPSKGAAVPHPRLRAALNGVGLAGVTAHFLGWPTTRRAGVLPVLTGRAEGLSPSWTRWYNPLLYAW